MKKNYMPVAGALAGFGAGLAAMYMLDPDRGARRRALAMDKVKSVGVKIPRVISGRKQDIANKTKGVIAEASKLFQGDDRPPDDVLQARVRSELGRIVSHPRAVDVRASNGTITLSGPILKAEEMQLVNTVRSIIGVRNVENKLEVHDSSADVPALQGGTDRADRHYTANPGRNVH